VVGFLLQDDAVEARKSAFDSWLDEQKRNAQQTVQQAQSTVQSAVQPVADEVQKRSQVFDDWLSSQPPPPPPPPPAPTPIPTPEVTPAPQPVAAPQTMPASPEAQQRSSVFDDWLNQLQQPTPTPAPVEQPQATGPVAPDHPPSPPLQTPGTQIANTPGASGQVFPLAVKPDNTPTATYHSQGGSDLMAPRGTPVLNMQGGRVAEVFTDNGSHTVGGNAVLVHGDDGLDYYYAHFDQPPGLKVGQRVDAGEQIGAVGNSGNAWKGGQGATHLHIGIGHGISDGVGSEGGLGQNFNAQQLLSDLQSGVGQATAAPRRALAATTAELSGGGPAGGLTDRAQQILGGAADAAGAFGGDAARAVQSVLVTEGGMNNARGDSGDSAGPLQFYGGPGGGQLNNLANQLGMGLDQAKQWVENNPVAAVQWALGSPDAPGYLGKALLEGARRGLSGPDLATFIQRTGQVSVSPERAGANYQNLFGQGQDAVRAAGQLGGDLLGTLGQGAQAVASRAQQLADQSTALAASTGQGLQGAQDLLAQTRASIAAENDRYDQAQRAQRNATLADIMQPRRFDLSMGQNQPADQGFRAPDLSGVGQALTDFGMNGPIGAFNQALRAGGEAFTAPLSEADRLALQQVAQGGPISALNRAIFTSAPAEALGALRQQVLPTMFDPGFAERERQELQLSLAAQDKRLAGREDQITPEERQAEMSQFMKVGGVEMPEVNLQGLRGLLSARTGPAAEAAAAEATRMLQPELARRIEQTAPEVRLPETPTRMFHGTVEDFPRARTDLPASEGENTLGPGYYLTPDPEHASLYARRPTGYYGEKAGSELGANVRAVDVPSDLRLFDLQARTPLDPTAMDAVVQAIRPLDTERANTLAHIAQATREGQLPGRSTSPQAIWDYLTTGPRALSVTEANRIVEQAGFDGIQGRTFAEGTAIFEPSVSKLRNAISGRQGGAANPMFAMRLGGAVGGGVLGNQTTPEDADPAARAAHILTGAALGASAPGLAMGLARRSPVSAAQLEALRPAALAAGALPNQTLASTVSTFGKANLLSGVTTHLSNIISQSIELGRQPLTRAASGFEDEAAAGLRNSASMLPTALSRAWDALRTGRSLYAPHPQYTPGAFAPLRVLGATDDFFRTLGEAMGRGMEAQRILREAGNPSNPAAISRLLQGKSTQIVDAGDRASRLSVFGEGATTGLGHWLSDTKQRLLNSPNRGAQTWGTLLDVLVPFSSIPDRIWTAGIMRTPGVAEYNAIRKMIGGALERDPRAIQQAAGDLMVGSIVNSVIISQVMNGNVTGPDDPEHPNSVKIMGSWVDYSNWGPYALPFAIPAAIVDSVKKTGNMPDANTLAAAKNAMNAVFKTMGNASYVSSLFRILGAVGEGQDIVGAGLRAGAGYVDRLVPGSGLLNNIEQVFDSHMPEVGKGPEQVWERQMSRIPGVAGMLPQKVSPTTGEPVLRSRAGPLGVLFRAETQESDPLKSELNRLDRAGFSVKAPTDYPDTVSYRGTEVKLRPDEQRAVTAELGKRRAELVQTLNSREFSGWTDAQKAKFFDSRLNKIADDKTRVWLRIASPADVDRRISAAQRETGRLMTRPQLSPIELETPVGGAA